MAKLVIMVDKIQNLASRDYLFEIEIFSPLHALLVGTVAGILSVVGFKFITVLANQGSSDSKEIKFSHSSPVRLEFTTPVV